MRDNPKAAFLLVNEGITTRNATPVATVRDKFEGFTKRQIKQAITARRLMSMIGSPSEREYQGLVRLNF